MFFSGAPAIATTFYPQRNPEGLPFWRHFYKAGKRSHNLLKNHKSSGFNPVCFAIFFNITGPISTES